ncbi:hypothetical protein [Paeniglutamicibacter terrestris]|uniref:Uncharacterized protein n=1 Tax=Paeniglutamicibacter terrestris TaxID=2723403 RepID=A0ABX1G2X9_9MICC|nr:hypothetical protein [Paeniglutamicibacter terrestris]NKG20593.1 hypothetical protein [Paeniglutamicibacter terrestris]
MREIEFRNLEIKPDRIDIQAVSPDGTHDLYFEFSQPVSISNTAVGVAMSTLCGRSFGRVLYDFPIDHVVLPAIRELTHAEVVVGAELPRVAGPRRGTLLSFSGGFDSLAAKLLMPNDTNLVSMDFGGRFAREREFFDNFDVLRVSTNLVNTPLKANSWSFMGIGAILASDHFRAKYHTFGGILEAGTDNMRLNPAAANGKTFPPFRASGYINAPYVIGLTEVGTLRVMLKNDPDLVAESLPSVASPGEEKLYRKAVLADVVSRSLGITFNRSDVPAPRIPHFRFGENFALDLLTLYVISQTGDSTALGISRDIPARVVQFAKNRRLAFMERVNPTLLENFPTELAPELHRRLAEYGICWYTEHDWSEFSQVRDLLSEYHASLRS